MTGLALPGLERLLVPYNLALFALLWGTGRIAHRSDHLRVERKMVGLLSVRAPNQVELVVSNEGSEPVGLRLRDEVPAGFQPSVQEFELVADPEREVSLKYSVTPLERGTYRFEGTFLRVVAPLGLCMVDKHLDNEQEVRVYPQVSALREFDLLKQRGRLNLIGVRRSRIKGLGQEFESLRDYNDDDFSLIDWKGTARRGKLVARNFQTERNQGVVLAVDAGRLMLAEVEGVRKLDHVLDAMLMLMHAAQRAGDLVGVLVFNDQVRRWLPPKKGTAQVAAIVDSLHDLQAEPVQPDYQAAVAYLNARYKRRSLLMVFTDAENEDQAAELAAALGAVRRRHLTFVARISDPLMREAHEKPVVDERDLFAHASTHWYLDDRRKAEATLVAAGMHMIEAEPQDLAAALVSTYLRVKEHSLL